MTKIYGRCPRCKSRIKINDAERLDGRKITCRGCRYAIRIRAPKATFARKRSKDLLITEFFDGDEEDEIETIPLREPEEDAASTVDSEEVTAAVDSDSDLPAYQPMLYRQAAKKKARVSRDDADDDATFVEAADGGAGAAGAKRGPLVLILGGVGGLLLVSLVVGGIVLLRSGIFKPAKYEPPQNYVGFAPKDFQLSAKVPEGWTQTYAGGEGGLPITARFASGSISVNVRESLGGGALGQAAIAMQGAAPGVPKEAPVVGIHAYHRRRFEEDYRNYNEGFERPIKTRGYGEGRISDFTANEGLFGLQVKGCRATVMNSIHQFTVTCKCPAGQFKDIKPVFEKIVASLSTGGD
jgi:hypothetical protein